MTIARQVTLALEGSFDRVVQSRETGLAEDQVCANDGAVQFARGASVVVDARILGDRHNSVPEAWILPGLMGEELRSARVVVRFPVFFEGSLNSVVMALCPFRDIGGHPETQEVCSMCFLSLIRVRHQWI